MVGIVKLVRNGNATQVTIPRPFLRFLEWSPADDVAILVNEDKSLTVFRVTPEELLATHQRARAASDQEPAAL